LTALAKSIKNPNEFKKLSENRFTNGDSFDIIKIIHVMQSISDVLQ
jgi:hypothetical protein